MKNIKASAFGIFIVILVAASAVQGYAVYRDSNVPRTRPPRLNVGDTLRNAKFVDGPKRSGIRARMRISDVTLDDLTSHGCVVLAFFESHCEGCRAIAPAWSNMDTLRAAGVRVPIYWVTAHRADDGAGEFVSSNMLGRRWFAIASRQDQYDLGVVSWPRHYLVGPGREFLGYLNPTPDSSATVPKACRS